jgi:mono/diheme cytochrome c family protein
VERVNRAPLSVISFGLFRGRRCFAQSAFYLHTSSSAFMEIQPSYRPMENPLPVPERSIPVEGPIAIPGMGAPENPTDSDDASIARGAELYAINCQMCHGQTAEGTGPIAPFLANKPANLTSPVVQSKSDGSIFLTITNGVTGKMPALNENFLVSERWDLVNYIRTLKANE